MTRKNDSSGIGVFIILIGIVLLLANFNVLRLSMFWGIVKLWPLLFVVLGLSILFKSSKHIGIILWLLFIGIVIVYSYLNMDQKSWSIGHAVDSILYEEKMNDPIETGEIDLDIKQGLLTIVAEGTDGIVYDIPENGIKEAYVESKLFKPTVLKIEDEDVKNNRLFSKRTYALVIPEGGKWSLDLDGGVISGKLDFSKIQLENLAINTGVLDTEILIGNQAQGKYSIDSGVGNLKINMPYNEDLGIKLIIESGLHLVDIDEKKFTKLDDTYTSVNYDQAKNKIQIFIDIGIGNIEVIVD